jgi:hypothetical protein
VTLFNFIIIAYGIHPSCGHVHLQGGHIPIKYFKDQSRIKSPQNFFWGLIHQGLRPRINPCHRHGYPGLCPGALGLSRGFNCLVLDQEPQSSTGGPLRGLLVPDQGSTGGPLRGLYCLVPDQEPQSSTGGPLRGLYCLVPDQEPQSSTGGPLRGLIHQGTRPRINPCPRHGYPGHFQGP